MCTPVDSDKCRTCPSDLRKRKIRPTRFHTISPLFQIQGITMTQFAIIICTIAWITAPAHCSDPKTAIILKDFEYNKEGIEVGRLRSFRRLVDASKIFIDRTMLIKELIEDDAKIIFIISPQRYGRTINLLMMADFLDNSPYTSAKNQRLFKYGEYITSKGDARHLTTPFLISKETEIMNQYQGKYPSIFLHLNDIGGNGIAEISHAFRFRIGEVFGRYTYLRHELRRRVNNATAGSIDKTRAEDNLHRFETFENRTANITELESSIDFLCDMLRQYHGRRAFVFVDNYDGLLNSYYLRLFVPDSQLKIVENFYSQFILKTLRSAHIKKCILTGILRVVQEVTYPDPKDVKVYTHLNEKIFRYYVLCKREVDELMHHVRIPYDLQDEAHRWYNGYKSGKDFAYYNPWSILKFFGKKVIQNNYENSRIVQYFMKKFVRCSTLRALIQSLVDGATITTTIEKLHFGKEVFFKLRNVLRMDPIPAVQEETVSACIAFFNCVGLLTFVDFPQHAVETGANVTLRIPNQEVCYEFLDELGYLDDVDVALDV